MSERGIGWPVVLLCQMAAVSARMRWATRMATPSNDRPPWPSRSGWPTDSINCRTGLSRACLGRGCSLVRAGRVYDAPGGQVGLELPGGEALIRDNEQTWSVGGQLLLAVRHRIEVVCLGG
jgi:hypothetical protein